MAKLVEKLADFTAGLKYEDLPAEVISESKRLYLDSIGCALGGINSLKGRTGIKLARRMGGEKEATVIGIGEKYGCWGVSFANGELINSLDFDPVLPPSHATPLIIPVPLALAESGGASGKDIILVNALAHELSFRMAAAMRGFRDVTAEKGKEKAFWPSLFGMGQCAIAGAAAAAKIMGLDSDKMTNALAISAHLAPIPNASGHLKEPYSPTHKYLMAGWVSHSILNAVFLADSGHLGNLGILESDEGRFWQMNGSAVWKPNEVTDGLGEVWRFPREVRYKCHPTAGGHQSTMDCFSAIVQKNNLRPEEIEKVQIWTEAIQNTPLFRNRIMRTDADGTPNVHYACAVTAYGVRPGPDWFSLENMTDPRILDFMKKVDFDTHPNYVQSLKDNPSSRIGKVDVTARGKVFSEERICHKGSNAIKEFRMSDQELADKFRHNASKVLPADKIEKAADCILNLEKLENISGLLNLVVF